MLPSQRIIKRTREKEPRISFSVVRHTGITQGGISGKGENVSPRSLDTSVSHIFFAAATTPLFLALDAALTLMGENDKNPNSPEKRTPGL